MPNIGMGDSHFDYMFVNDALSDEDHFSNLQLVESRYLKSSRVEGYQRLLHQADSKIDWRYRIARWMIRVADDFMLKRDTGKIRRMICKVTFVSYSSSLLHLTHIISFLRLFKALIALDYFDRLMMAQSELKRDQFQVAAIASLFVASKIHQKRHIKVSTVSG